MSTARSSVHRTRHRWGRQPLIITLALMTFWYAPAVSVSAAELSWEMPGKLAIYDLQFGPAVLRNDAWQFLGNIRHIKAGTYGDRLTMMVRFAYTGSRPDIPLRFVIKLPDARQYEETIRLPETNGDFTYKFTVHQPEDFAGNGSVYLYYGISIVDVLDFAISPEA